MARRYLIIFASAFVLNLLWEEAHSVFYIHYRGAAITHVILLQAALFDAAVITFASFLFFRLPLTMQKKWLLFTALTLFAILLERWALMTGRWVYTDSMPIIPLLSVGLTPAIQLGVLGHLSLRISICLGR